MFLYVRMFLHTGFETMCAKTSVQLESDILVFSKWLMGSWGSWRLLIDLLDIILWNLTRSPSKFVLLYLLWKRKHQVNNRVVILHTVDLTVCKCHINFYWINQYVIERNQITAYNFSGKAQRCHQSMTPLVTVTSRFLTAVFAKRRLTISKVV